MNKLIIAFTIVFCAISMATAYGYGGSSYGHKAKSWKKQEVTSCGHGSPCHYPSGLFPNYKDCCSFFNCDRCQAFEQKCGPGTLFSAKHKVCVHPNQSDCTAPNKHTCGKVYWPEKKYQQKEEW